MKWRKLFYSVMLAGSIGSLLRTNLVALANETSPNEVSTTSTEAGTLESISRDPQELLSSQQLEQTEHSEETSSSAPEQTKSAEQQKSSNAITDDWTVNKSIPGEIELIGYSGNAKDVIVPNSADFGEPDSKVTMTKNIMTRAATVANNNNGTFKISDTAGKKVHMTDSDLSNGFISYDKLTAMDLSHLETSIVSNLAGLFINCTSLESVNLTDWNTSQVTLMNNMFTNCPALTSVSFGNWDTSKVTNMIYMFYKCTSLENINLHSFDTSNVTNMEGMFRNCEKLVTLDLSHFNTSKVTNINYMFKDCHLLKTLDLYSFDLTQVAGFTEVFSVPGSKEMTIYATDEKLKNYNYLNDNVSVNFAGDTTSIEAKDSTIFLGASWKAADNFVGAKDHKDDPVAFSDITVTGAEKVNTSKLGAYKVTYEYGGKSKTITVTVKAAPVTQYTVTFKAETGGSLSGTTSVKVNKGSKVSTIPTVKTNSDYTFNGWYNGSTKVEPKNVVINGNTTFTAKFTKKATPSKKVAIYRLYNPNSGEHFYTATISERDKVRKAGWRYEGIGWYASSKGIPVYRLYNPNAGDHHFTLNTYERDNLKKLGWRYEGIGFYSGGNQKVYRQYNPNAKAGAHNYTLNTHERDLLLKKGWRNEGVGWNAE